MRCPSVGRAGCVRPSMCDHYDTSAPAGFERARKTARDSGPVCSRPPCSDGVFGKTAEARRTQRLRRKKQKGVWASRASSPRELEAPEAQILFLFFFSPQPPRPPCLRGWLDSGRTRIRAARTVVVLARLTPAPSHAQRT